MVPRGRAARDPRRKISSASCSRAVGEAPPGTKNASGSAYVDTRVSSMINAGYRTRNLRSNAVGAARAPVEGALVLQ